MARPTPTYTPVRNYVIGFSISLLLLFSDINYGTFAPLRGFLNASTLYAQMISKGIFENLSMTLASIQKNKSLLKENKELRAADARREKALQDALKLLSVATRGKQEAQREATRHKREMRRAATRRMIARGPALPSAVQERLRVMQARVEALEVAYAHPPKMKAEEEGVPLWSEKRLLQLNFLFKHVGGALKEEQAPAGA